MIEQDPLFNYSFGLNNQIINSYAGNDNYSSILETSILQNGLDALNVMETLTEEERINRKNKEDLEAVANQETIYKTMDELKEDLKKCSKEDIHKHLALAFQDFTKNDVYKELLAGLKCDYPHLKDYLLHLAIFNWYRDMYIENLPEEKKGDFVDIYDTSKVETKLNMKKGGEEKSIKAYSPDEYAEEFKHLKEVEYVNTDDNIPFKILDDES
jgi:hypothetical protein